MSEQVADHLWDALDETPLGASIVKVPTCCDLPQSAHPGLTWGALKLWTDRPSLARKLDALTAELAERTRKRDRLQEWRDSVSTAVKNIPEFHSGEWGGDKEGWGFHFEVVNWLIRERDQARADLAALRGKLEYQNRVEWHKRAGVLAMVIWHLTAVTVRAITVSACEDRGCDHPACRVIRECQYARAVVREYELQDEAPRPSGPEQGEDGR